jgi:hypothetical protein
LPKFVLPVFFLCSLLPLFFLFFIPSPLLYLL